MTAPGHRGVETPLSRCRFVNDGDTVDVGDRMLVAVRPPLPVLRGRRIDEAFDLIRQLPALDPWREFDQSDLDGWRAAAGTLSEPSTPAH